MMWIIVILFIMTDKDKRENSKEVKDGEEFLKLVEEELKIIHEMISMIKKEAARNNIELKGKFMSHGKK